MGRYQLTSIRGKDGNLVVPTNSNIGSPTPSDSVPGNGTTSGESLPGATSGGAPNAGAIVGIIIGVLAALVSPSDIFESFC